MNFPSNTGSLRLQKFSAAKQRRLDTLLDKHGEGTISPREKVTLEKLVAEAEQLMVSNAKRLAEFCKSDQEGVPADAVPVTVWVAPIQAKR